VEHRYQGDCGHHTLTTRPSIRQRNSANRRLAREHWTIENNVHWIRDVTFAEDVTGNPATGQGASSNVKIHRLNLLVNDLPRLHLRRARISGTRVV
jgi:predicted transposase YbfD/YdcC